MSQQQPAPSPTRFPTLDQAWLVVALALIALRPLLTAIPPHDFWWHMATGREIVQSWSIPTVDHFSYTRAGEPFYNQGWLAQVFMYGLHSLGGVELIVLVQAVVVALAYGVLVWLGVWRSGAPRLSAGVLLLLIMPMSFDNWNVRPQSYAFPFFAAFLAILTMWRLGRGNRLWLLPPLMVVWVNLHGSFVLGGALMALTFVGEAVRRMVVYIRGYFTPPLPPEPGAPGPSPPPPLRALFWWGVATAAAMLLNPRGVGVIGYVLNLLGTSAVTTLVTEWAPPTIRTTSGAIFFGVLIVCGVVLAYARSRPDPVDMLLALPLLWLALGAERNVVWFGMIILPLLATQVAALAPRREGAQKRHLPAGSPLANAAVIGMAVLLLLLGLPWVKPLLPGLPPDLGRLVSPATPVEAVEALKADPDPPQHLYHAMSYGSYLIWAAPEQPVFADPRIELYPYEQWQDYIRLNAGIMVDPLLAKYEIDGLLLSNEEQANLLASVRNKPAWEVRYQDARTTYLVRDESSSPAGASHSLR